MEHQFLFMRKEEKELKQKVSKKEEEKMANKEVMTPEEFFENACMMDN